MISINLFKVSYDSSALQLIADCPTTQKFDKLLVEVRFLEDKTNPKAKFISEKYDLSTYFEDQVIDHCALDIPLDVLGSHDHGIYKVTIKTVMKESFAEEDCSYCHFTGDEDTAITSDVNFVYDNFKSLILAAGDACGELSDDLVRNYLILFGHHNAMALHDWCTAELYYKMLVKNFSVCGEGSPCKTVNLSCGCGKGSATGESMYHSAPRPSCGCGK